MKKNYLRIIFILSAIVLHGQTVDYTGSFSSFSTLEAVPSSSQSISLVAYTFGACTDLEITPPSGFEVSTDDASWVTSTLTIPKVNDTVIATLYVRMSAGPVGPMGGNIDVRTCAGAIGFTENPGSFTVSGNSCPSTGAAAGADQMVCASQGFVNVTGNGGVGSETWSSSGTGTFINPSITSTDYNFSPADIASGFVTLTYQLSVGGCGATSDDLLITILPEVSVNAGANQSLCAITPFASLNASSTGTTHNWTAINGTGTFSNNTALNPLYTISPSDVANGFVDMEFSSSDGNGCQNKDTITITFSPGPTVNAGADNAVCSNASFFPTAASASGNTSTNWSTSGNGTFDNANVVITNYTITPADIASGVVTLTLTATDTILGCVNSDNMTLVINSAPTVNAGPDVTICSKESSTLNGTVSLGNALWSILLSGNGVFSNASNVTTTYSPGALDEVNGTVYLSLSGNNGGCVVSDSLTLTIIPSPAVTLGADTSFCSNANPIALSSSMQNAAGIVWSTNGSGVFTPNATVANPTYIPSANDTLQPSIKLSVITTGNGVCLAGMDTIKVIYIQPGILNAGADLSFCGDEVQITTASVSNGEPFIWSQISGPTVSIEPDTSSPQPFIVFGSDSISGTVVLTLQSYFGCSAEDTVTITKSISGLSSAEFSSSKIVTSLTAGINLGVSIVGGTTIWQVTGTGTIGGVGPYFYTPSAQDLTDGFVEIVANTQGSGLCNSYYSSDTISLVLTNLSSLHSIQGTFDGNSYRAILSKELNSYWVTVYDTIFPTSNYTFQGLTQGNYKLQAIPPAGASKVAAYHGNVEDWKDATIIALGNSDLTGIDINLPSFNLPPDTIAKYFGGVDKVVGRILLNVAGSISNLRTLGDNDLKPVGGATIIITNSSNTSKLGTTTTDANGFYSVDNLNSANLNITVEYPGTVVQGTTLANPDQTQSVNTDGDADPTTKNVQVVRIDDESASKLVSTADPISFKAGSILYPNPAANAVYIKIPEKMSSVSEYRVILFDASGRPVLNSIYKGTSQALQLDLTDCKEGMYYLHLSGGNLQTTEKLIIE
jgi:hypothetical protein